MNTKTKQILLAGAIVLIVGSIVFLESGKVSPTGEVVDGNNEIVIEPLTDEEIQERIKEKEGKYERAKEISTPNAFVNVDDINITDLIGEKIILVDFWTYSCINCIRTLPYLNSWHEKYADQGLVILGLHTPEFEFEKDLGNVERAVEKFGIQYPIILDNDYSTWTAYRNRYWPRKYLIDIDGFIVYNHIGEGGYDETEAKIVELLNEKNSVLGGKEVVRDMNTLTDVVSVDNRRVQTPEIYLGSLRIEYIANLPSLDCFGTSCNYTVLNTVQLNSYQLDGTWNIGGEESTLESESGSIFIRFFANTVNLVVGSEDEVSAEIYLDGELAGDDQSGSDVVGGTVLFKEHTLYNLIDLEGQYGEHLLEIRFLEPGVSAFAFTFG